MQTALVFGAAALALALIGTPLMHSASIRFARDASPGIDRTITGSVRPAARFTIRRSVLSEGAEVLCESGSPQRCAAAR